jgi:hypothetical protein
MDTTQTEVGNGVLEHTVTDAVAPASQSFENNSAIDSVDQMVSNAEFLGALFPKLDQDECLWTTEFVINPKDAKGKDWDGSKIYLDHVRDTPHGNSYFSVAALKPVKRSFKRRRENFSHMPVVVLDDSKGCDLAPTWRLETSQDNYQTGFLLDKPITDVEIASRLMTALVEQGCVKLDKNGNNPVRYMRLPAGRNTKYQPPFQCRLAVWNPNHKVSLTDLCHALKIDHNEVVNGAPKKPAPPKKSSQPTVRTIIDLGSAIDHLDADGYSDWVKIGLALSSLKGTDLQDSALELFHKVSEKSDKYDAAECDAKWRKDLNADSLTYKSIFLWAMERGWVNPAKQRRDFSPLWALAQKLEMDEDELCKAIDYKPEVVATIVSSCAFSQSSSKFLALEPSGDLRVFLKTDLSVGINGTFGHTHDTEALIELASSYADGKIADKKEKEKFVGSCVGLIFSQIQKHILVERQYAELRINVDMFAEEASVSLHDGQAKITYPHVPMPTGVIDPAIVADYKQHWPMIDEFLDLLVACRFAQSRKKAFVWIKTQSDWGKSFLLHLLANLDLALEMSASEVERAFSGQPVGATLNSFKRAWVLAIEEFKSVKSELKQLEQQMQFSPKGLPTVTAPLYLKLFLSAERVESLASGESGVEDQFANRFSLVEPEGGRLSERPLFQQSQTSYSKTMTNYVAEYLNRKVGEYRSLGAIGAADKGDAEVRSFHRKHGIGHKFERLSTKLPQLAEQFREWIMSNYRSAKAELGSNNRRSLSKCENEVLQSAMLKDEPHGQMLYVQRCNKLLAVWLEDSFNQSERGKLHFKQGDIAAALPARKTVYFEHNCHKVMFVGCLDKHRDVDFDPSDYQET